MDRRAGEHGCSLYPLMMSSEVRWPDGAEEMRPILREHDIQLLGTGPSAAGAPKRWYNWDTDPGMLDDDIFLVFYRSY